MSSYTCTVAAEWVSDELTVKKEKEGLAAGRLVGRKFYEARVVTKPLNWNVC